MIRIGIGLGLGYSNSRRKRANAKERLEAFSHELLIPIELLHVAGSTDEGQLVRALSFPWLEIYQQLERNPSLLFDFSHSPRKFEEFIAASYERAGYLVTLTPNSGDGGSDVIAEKRGFGSVRILDQCKAFGRGRKVGPNDVRAIMGTLLKNSNASKAVLTTTSAFSPSIAKEWEAYMPFRLELRDGKDILNWISDLK